MYILDLTLRFTPQLHNGGRGEVLIRVITELTLLCSVRLLAKKRSYCLEKCSCSVLPACGKNVKEFLRSLF